MVIVIAVGCHHPAQPTLGNAEPQPPPAIDDSAEEDPVTPIPDRCAELEAAQAEFAASGKGADGDGPGGEDHDYPPDCRAIFTHADAASPPWSRPEASCWVNDSIYGPAACTVSFGWGGRVEGLTVEYPGASADPVVSIVEGDLIPGGRTEAMVRMQLGEHEQLVVCRAAPRLSCTAPRDISGEGWAAWPHVENGALVLERGTGDAPAGALGRFPLVFPPD